MSKSTLHYDPTQWVSVWNGKDSLLPDYPHGLRLNYGNVALPVGPKRQDQEEPAEFVIRHYDLLDR